MKGEIKWGPFEKDILHHLRQSGKQKVELDWLKKIRVCYFQRVL